MNLRSTKPYVSKGALADKKRRQVRTTGVGRLGKRTVIPRQKRQARRRPKYRKSAALGALSGFFVVVCAATGSVFAAVGALTSAGAGVGVAYLEYRRDLITVKRTGKPIQDPGPVARQTVTTEDLEPIREPRPVDLDQPRPAQRQPQAAARTRKPTAGKHGPPGHEATCKAKTPQSCPYWRKAHPGAAKRKTTARKHATSTRRKT